MRRHGTRTRYVNGPDQDDRPGKGCRCSECRAANTEHENRVYRLKAYGQWRPYVNAEPVRQHILDLGRRGLVPKRVAELAGVSVPTVARIVYGEPWKNSPAPQRIRSATAVAILAVTSGTPRRGTPIDGTGTRRRLQALVAAGWTLTNLAQQYGLDRSSLAVWIHADNVWAGTAGKVRDLYYAAWDVTPPLASAQARGASEKAKAWARSSGWPPPAAWDDDLIDLPGAELAVALRERAEAMTDEETGRCYRARYMHGDTSPLTDAGAREHHRRRKVREQREAAA